MKKAKAPSDIKSKASDFFSVLNNLTQNSKTEKNDENVSDTAKPNNFTKPFGDVLQYFKGAPKEDNNIKNKPYTPFAYNLNAYQHIVEKHDKTVKNILQKHKK